MWRGDTLALLIGGGSGVVPLMAMLRLTRSSGHSKMVQVVVSVRRTADLYYADELPGPETTIVYTREAPSGASRSPGHLQLDDLPADLAPETTVFVCGSSGFADAATGLVMARGVAADHIRVERFGASQ